MPSDLFFPDCNRPPVVLFIARFDHCPASCSDVRFELASLVKMVEPVVCSILTVVPLSFHDPGDHDILLMPSVPTPATRALFECPNEDKDLACDNFSSGWLDCPQKGCDSLHSSSRGSEVMDDGDGNDEIKG